MRALTSCYSISPSVPSICQYRDLVRKTGHATHFLIERNIKFVHFPLFYIVFFKITVTSWGREEACAELETREGSDSTKYELLGNTTRSPADSWTEAEDIDDACSSVSSATSKILGTHSDSDRDFDPDLQTEYPSPVKYTTDKGVFIEETVIIADDGKSEETKIVPVSTEKSSTDNGEASQPQAESETPSLDTSYVNTVLLDSLHDNYSTHEEDSNVLTTHMCKKEFIDHGHVSSGKYFLPWAPNLTKLAKRSGLLSSLIINVIHGPLQSHLSMVLPQCSNAEVSDPTDS